MRLPGDRVRGLASASLFLAAIPWLAALIGVSLDHVPALNSMFLSDSFVDQPGVTGSHPAVHAGLPSWPLRGAAGGERSLALTRARRGHQPHSSPPARGISQLADRLRRGERWAFAIILAVAALTYLAMLRPDAILNRTGQAPDPPDDSAPDRRDPTPSSPPPRRRAGEAPILVIHADRAHHVDPRPWRLRDGPMCAPVVRQ